MSYYIERKFEMCGLLYIKWWTGSGWVSAGSDVEVKGYARRGNATRAAARLIKQVKAFPGELEIKLS